MDESGEASALPLSYYISSFKRHPIFSDEAHQRGFLHRLDVPSSGLILVASTYEAYYDLQFQLSLGMITRDYTSLCHGWFAGDRDVRASVAWSDSGVQQDTPSVVSQSSAARSNARSHVKLLGHLRHLGHLGHSVRSTGSTGSTGRTRTAIGTAVSLLGIRIATGRKHQIRVHLAHVGHPTVSDGGLLALEDEHSTRQRKTASSNGCTMNLPT